MVFKATIKEINNYFNINNSKKHLHMKLTKFLTGMIILVVFSLTGCQKEPSASFTASKTIATLNEKITFTNTTGDGDHYEWDFGDGSKSEEASPSHSYTKVGNYVVTLKAFSKNGKKTSSVSETITIGLPPVCQFSYLPLYPMPNLPILFTDNSSNNPTSWLWDFGDGDNSSLQNPTHQFTLADTVPAGTFIVTLKVTNALGTHQLSKNIHVGKYGLYYFIGNYNVDDNYHGATTHYTDSIIASTTDTARFYFKKFSNNQNGSVYFNVNGTNINIPSQTINCGTPPNNMNHTFLGNGHYMLYDTIVILNIDYSDSFSVNGVPLTYTGYATYTETSGKLKRLK
jgi:PKD repeat protein